MKKAIFLDRDGTINVEKQYLWKLEDFQFERGALEGLQQFKQFGYLLIVISNQAGIGRGYYTEDDLFHLNTYLMEQTAMRHCAIDRIYYCPHHPTEGIGKYKVNCDCRKPKTGMIDLAIKEFKIDRDQSYVVGDKISDMETGLLAKITPILVRTGYGLETEKIWWKQDNKCDLKVFDTLFDFSQDLKNLTAKSNQSVKKYRKIIEKQKQ